MLLFFVFTDKRFYRERKSFLCIDGSKMIPFEQVNDDYCDCADGSDEPGKRLNMDQWANCVMSVNTVIIKHRNNFCR